MTDSPSSIGCRYGATDRFGNPLRPSRRGDLLIEAVYCGSDKRQQDALPPLLGVGVQGGFRIKGRRPNYRLVALTTSGAEAEWPDSFDPATGRLVYFGDNRQPGSDLHKPKGNYLLNHAFEATHATPHRRHTVPPFLVFRWPTPLDPPGATNRDLVFVGLAAPGAPDLGEPDDLVAAWRTKGGRRFQNYRESFTILDCHPIPRRWITSLQAGNPNIEAAPDVWREWVETGRHNALTAPERPRYRSEAEQWPTTTAGVAIIRAIRHHFMPDPDDKKAATRFEKCAAEIWRMGADATVNYQVTRPVVDRGRDAIGELLLGPDADPIPIDFSLEAKLYDYEAGNRVTTGDVKRLISRLRHRQFGVVVTTSVVHRQAYDEIREDRHPVVIISARDIVDTLSRHGLSDVTSVRQ